MPAIDPLYDNALIELWQYNLSYLLTPYNWLQSNVVGYQAEFEADRT